MQLRISNAYPTYQNMPFNTSIQPNNHSPHRPIFNTRPQPNNNTHKPVFHYHSPSPHNIYNDQNPYHLYLAPYEPKHKPLISTRHTNYSRELSQNSSQRSLKVIRANGLRLAEKPKIGRTLQSNSRHDHQGIFNHKDSKVTEFQVQQNRALREQNVMLRDKLRACQQSKNRQLGKLQQRIEYLMKMTGDLSSKIIENEEQWRLELAKIKENAR